MPFEPLYTSTGAEFSQCQVYRYTLTRWWDRLAKRGRVCWVMLNPSTADALVDDPTVRRCAQFSHRWGYGGMIVVNIFGLRATDPKHLRKVADPVGPDNDFAVIAAATACDLVMAAWGTHGGLNNRGCQVHRKLARTPGLEVYALGVTSGGFPKHPLYIKGDVVKELFPYKSHA